MKIRFRPLPCLFALALVLPAAAAHAATYNYVNGLTIDSNGNIPQNPPTVLSTGDTLSVAGGNGFIVGLNGTSTFVQSGGTATTAVGGYNLILGYNAGSSGTYGLQGGTFATNTLYIGLMGTGTFNQSGGTTTANSGVILAQNTGSGATYFFDGGTLATPSVRGDANSFASSTSTFNFNGGTLQATANSTTFIQGLTTADIRNNGAIIDTNGFSVTAAQKFIHSSGFSGDAAIDGGVIKQGLGTLTLGGTNTYTGNTTITNGRVAIASAGNLGTGGTTANTNNAVVFNGTGTSKGELLATNSMSLGRAVTVSANASATLSAASGTFTVNGAFSTGNGSTLNFGSVGNTGYVSLAPSAVPTGSAAALNVNAGTLILGNANAAALINNSATQTIATGATLDLNGNTATFNNLQGRGTLGILTGASGATAIVNSGDFSGVIGGFTGLVKNGTGILTLSGVNTYTRETSVNGGTLLVNNAIGSGNSSGNIVNVNSGGTLGGNGTIGGSVYVQGGTLAPGSNGFGRLTVTGSLSLNPGSTLNIELGGLTAGASYDQLAVSGTLTLGGTLNVTRVNGFTLAVGQSFNIVQDSGPALVSSTFANAPGGVYTDAAGDTFLVNYAANTDGGTVPNDVTLTVLTVAPVPEPSTWAALCVGAALLGLTLRRARRVRAA